MPANNDEKINESVRQINNVMKRKLSLLYEMHNLSAKAYNYISEDSVEPLNNIFEAKQELIHEIDQLDRVFLDGFEQLKSGLGLSSIADLRQPQSPQLKDLQLNTAEIMDLMQKIGDLDAKLNQKIVKLREDIAADLTRIRRQKQVSGFYSNDNTRRQKDDQPDMSAPPNFDKKN